jgi:hypothetical protein
MLLNLLLSFALVAEAEVLVPRRAEQAAAAAAAALTHHQVLQ